MSLADARGQQHEEDDDAAGNATRAVAPSDPKARPKWLHDHLAKIMAATKLPGAKIGVAVIDLATGDELFGKDADTSLNLASNTKLLTTTAALATLGPGFRWRTAVYADKLDDATGTVDGDLYLRGRGDPLLS